MTSHQTWPGRMAWLRWADRRFEEDGEDNWSEQDAETAFRAGWQAREDALAAEDVAEGLTAAVEANARILKQRGRADDPA